jgi:hypothetical protein
MKTTRQVMLFVAAACLAGCSFFYDLDSVEFGDGDAGVDMSETTDMDDATDMPEPPACDPLDASTCGPDEYCAVELASGEVSCAPRVEGTAAEGETCESDESCAGDLRCVDWVLPDPRGKVCSTICELETNIGCGLGEFCSRTDGAFPEDVGFCTPQCDVLDVRTCGAEFRCVPDPYFEGSGFPPFSRCLVNAPGEEPEDGSLGRECNPLNMHELGCIEGFTCLTVAEGPRCLQPCINIDDCSTTISYRECGEIVGSTTVGFCSP